MGISCDKISITKSLYSLRNKRTQSLLEKFQETINKNNVRYSYDFSFVSHDIFSALISFPTVDRSFHHVLSENLLVFV